MHNAHYISKVFYSLRPDQTEYSAEDIRELESYGVQTTDRIREVV